MTSKKVALITGVSSGIGLATARLFCESGWLVVGSTRDKHKPVELATMPIDFQKAEMASPKDLERLVKNTIKTYGRVDALINNAGYGLLNSVEGLSYEEVEQQFRVNTLAVIELSRLVLVHMKKQGSGTIVAVSSIAGRLGLPSYGAYAASKYAVEGFMECLRAEVEELGIHARIIEPSVVNTPFWQNAITTNPDTSGVFDIHKGLNPAQVAKGIYEATVDTSSQFRYPLGLTRLAVAARHILPDRIFFWGLRRYLVRQSKSAA
jgi:short-subunit dehydrogenase